MTVERNVVVGLADLKTVIFECRQERCKTRVTVLPDHARIPPRCPGCGQEWAPKHPPETIATVSNYANLVESIAKIRAQEPNDEWPKFRILLGFDEPELAGSRAPAALSGI
jgi:hypothetical protein